MEISFRRLDQDDAKAMATLEAACFSLPWSGAQCRGAFAQPAFAAFGLSGGERLMAYVSIYHILPEMEILNVAVEPGLRRRGLGRRLLSLVLQAGAKMGMQKASLEVREGNLAAIRLYEGLGFERCGMRARYYPDNGETALIYALEL